MEQEQKKGPGVFGLLALVMVFCLTLSLAGDRAEAVTVAVPAAVPFTYSSPSAVVAGSVTLAGATRVPFRYRPSTELLLPLVLA